MSLILSYRPESKLGQVDFNGTARSALIQSLQVVENLLPNGRRNGHEWVSKNPTRQDKSPGSFSVNLKTGRWADFATSESGGDLISLAAYINGTRQSDAAIYLNRLLNLEI